MDVHVNGHAAPSSRPEVGFASRALLSGVSDFATNESDDLVASLRCLTTNLASMVARGWLDKSDVVDAITDAARANGLLGQLGDDSFQTEFASAFIAGQAAPHPDLSWKQQARSSRPHDWRTDLFTAADLQRERFPEVPFIVPGMIPEGLTLLASKPKKGKSLMMLDVALGVATGSQMLGNLKTPEPGAVLYLGLEENRRRLQRRIDKLISPFSTEWPQRLTLTTVWRSLDQGGLADLEEWCAEVDQPRLIIVDTLACVRPRSGKSNAYEADYHALAGLHRLANDKKIGVIVVHHDRKMDADDPFDTISGTQGLAAAADTILVLKGTSQGNTLYGRGRDIEEFEQAVQFDKEALRWRLLGNAKEVRLGDGRRAILEVLRENSEPMGPTELTAATGIQNNNIRQHLRHMVIAGQIRKVARGRYEAL